MSGPYNTEQDARADCAWDETAPGARLTQVCRQAGVSLGAFDERIIRWLSDWEDTTVQVVADLITRAYAAGAEDRRRVDALGEIPPADDYTPEGGEDQ